MQGSGESRPSRVRPSDFLQGELVPQFAFGPFRFCPVPTDLAPAKAALFKGESSPFCYTEK